MLVLNILSEMDGKNSWISNFTKMQSFLLSIPLNQSITELGFFRWLRSRCFISAWLIFSNLTLLTLPSSLFQGLKRRQGKLAWKLSLWSFRVMNARFFVTISLFHTRSSFLAMFFASKLIDFSRRSVHFYKGFVTFSFRSFWYCSGGALYILLVLSANMKTSDEEFIIEISSFICSWKSSVDFLYFRELTILYKSFLNISNSVYCAG